MNPKLFLADILAKPAALTALADTLEREPPFSAVPREARRVLFLGMGSSRYAALVAAQRLRAAGIDAVAEYASARLGYPPAGDMLVVVISASGESVETLDALGRYRGVCPVVALTNSPASRLAHEADVVVPLHAGTEAGGVACRTFQHTGLLLQALVEHLTGVPANVPELCRRVAAASADLLDRRADWLDETVALLDGPHGVYFLAPAERFSSAAQSALMIREGPRRAADACETGDWAHVDVYLTKTLDYRAVLFPGSAYDGQAMQWMTARRSTVVTVGGEVPGATRAVRFLGDDDPDVALHTETLVAELVAAAWWEQAEPSS